MQLLYVVFVKSLGKLLKHLMFDQTLIEVKMEMLKTREFHHWKNFVTLSCGRREDGSHVMIDIDPHSVYHFGYPQF